MVADMWDRNLIKSFNEWHEKRNAEKGENRRFGRVSSLSKKDI